MTIETLNSNQVVIFQIQVKNRLKIQTKKTKILKIK